MEIILPLTKRKLVVEKNLPLPADRHGVRQADLKNLTYSAILSRDSLSYAVINNKNSVIDHGNVKVKDILLPKEHAPNGIWEKIQIALNNPIYTFVSQDQYDTRHVQSMLSFSNHIADIEKYQICSELIEKHNIWLVYAIPKEMIKSLRRYLDNFYLTHYQRCFLSCLKSANKKPVIKGSLISGHLNLALLLSGKLVISNTYPAFNESEFYYFISLLFDQYKLRTGQVDIILQGDFEDVHLDRDRFRRLFGVFPQFQKGLDIVDKLDPASRYTPLLELHQCAL